MAGAVLGVLAIGGCTKPSPPADLVISNARVWTVDAARGDAQAVAVTGDRIVAVGTTDEIGRYRGERTKVIDAAGRFLMPGFNDSHIHLMMAGESLDAVQLRDASTPEVFLRRIAERARQYPGEWIVGGNWDEQDWPGRQMPNRQMIDTAAPDTPVFVYRYDRHTGIANSAAIRLAGLGRTTKDVAGGVIGRDEKGELNGIFKDNARRLVETAIPPDSAEKLTRKAKRALLHMAELGVTSVQDMSPQNPTPDGPTVGVFADLAARGELTARVRVVRHEMGLVDELSTGGIKSPAPTHFLRVTGAKAFSDGSLGARTAFFFEPYTDDPKTSGILMDEMQPLDGMRSRLTALDRAGQQMVVHAIGDRAISMVLDLIADVQQANGQRDRRPRVEHAQHISAGDFDRFAKLGVIASVQPYHAIDDGRWAESRIGAERLSGTYAFKSFLDHGVRLAIGTDWPVAPLDPMATLYAGATRATLDGRHPQGWLPEQKLTVQQLIEGYTLGAAYAEFQERDKGSITAGKLADMVLLDGDPLRLPPEDLKRIKVTLTIAGGKVVYDSAAPADR